MKNKLLLTAIFLIFFFFKSFSQSFNLKDLEDLSVQIKDNTQLFSNTTSQKLLTEIKLHLISAGLKITTDEKSKAKMVVAIDYIKSTFAEQRMLVQLYIIENVIAERPKKIKTQALTYFNYSLFKAQNVGNSVYSVVMDSLLIKFIDDYLAQKNNSQ